MASPREQMTTKRSTSGLVPALGKEGRRPASGILPKKSIPSLFLSSPDPTALFDEDGRILSLERRGDRGGDAGPFGRRRGDRAGPPVLDRPGGTLAPSRGGGATGRDAQHRGRRPGRGRPPRPDVLGDRPALPRGGQGAIRRRRPRGDGEDGRVREAQVALQRPRGPHEPRRPDRLSEPRQLPVRSRPGDRRGRPDRAAARPPLRRARPVQVAERHARPRGRRRVPALPRPRAPREPRAAGAGGAGRGRRDRPPPSRDGGGRSRDARRGDRRDDREDGPGLGGKPALAVGERGRLRLSGPRRRRGGPRPRGRPRHAPGEAPRRRPRADARPRRQGARTGSSTCASR